MDEINLLYLIYGMCIMFHLMMGWVFCCRKTGLVKKLIGLLMLLVAVQYAKDLVFIRGFYSDDQLMERIASSIDIVTVPLYVLILIEFCRPGWLTMRRALFFELPFMVLSLLFMTIQNSIFFYAMVTLSGVYGVSCAIWTLCELPRYHRRLKEEYSYDEDINLHWMRGVMVLFFVILMIWVVGNVYATPFTDILYMTSSLIGWAVVCYFINKQEIVLRDVVNSVSPLSQCGEETKQSLSQTGLKFVYPLSQSDDESECTLSQAVGETNNPLPQSGNEDMESLDKRLKDIFEQEKIYLEPKLRLSELAVRLGTNRTYLSQYFNQSCEQSFYEYVNNYRVQYSMQLLRDTSYNLDVVASMSGFNSMSTFRRAFLHVNGISPQQYRACNVL